jgi:plastocyanin
MVMVRHVIVAGIASAALAFAASAPGAGSAVKLNGTVGPGFTITLTKSGKKVKSLTAGTYKIVVKDLSSAHNFVLEKARAGKFEKSITSVAFTGKKTVTVKLTQGKWEFYCAPHEAQMRGEFTVH